MVASGPAEQVADGQAGVAGADDDGVNGSHGGSFRWVGPARVGRADPVARPAFSR